MKTFNDLEIGDYIYQIKDNNVSIFQITNIINYVGVDVFYTRFSGDSVIGHDTICYIPKANKTLCAYKEISNLFGSYYVYSDKEAFLEHLEQIPDREI